MWGLKCLVMSSSENNDEEIDQGEQQEEDLGPVLEQFKKDWRMPFLGGIIIGIIAALVLSVGLGGGISGGPTQDSATISETESNLNRFLGNNTGIILPGASNHTIDSISQHQKTGLYRANITLTGSIQGQEINENGTVYITQNGKYVFFGSPIPLSRDINIPTQPQPQQNTTQNTNRST